MASIKSRIEQIEQRAGRYSRHTFPPILIVTDKEAQAEEVAEYRRKYGGMGLVLTVNRKGER
jgi:hypothetical protein